MSARRLVPSAVSAARLASLPPIVYFLSCGNAGIASILFVLALASDAADGFLARRLGAATRLGGYFDAAADFALIGGIFFHFAAAGAYPWWAFALIAVMFAQFVATSAVSKVMYDPFGKWYGSLLFGAAGLSIISPGGLAGAVVLASLVGITAVQVAVRGASLAGKGSHPLLVRLGRSPAEAGSSAVRLLSYPAWSGSVFFMGHGGAGGHLG